jgi:hypothetical protein
MDTNSATPYRVGDGHEQRHALVARGGVADVDVRRPQQRVQLEVVVAVDVLDGGGGGGRGLGVIAVDVLREPERLRFAEAG